jgi:sigma-54 dependent transcriptional regulator, flagellar regulatory protein
MTSRDGAEAAWTPAPATPAAELSSNGASTAPDGGGTAVPAAPTVTLPVDLPTMLREIENTYINAALAQTRSNKKEAAKLLGMGRTTLVEKLRRRSMAASRP